MLHAELIRLAEKSGLTGYRLAKLTGLSAPGVRNLLAARKSPSLDTAERIAAALGYELRLVKPKGNRK